MADNKSTIEINVEAKQAVNSLKQLRDELKKAKADALNGDGAAAKRVAELTDKMDDLKDSVQTLKGSGVEQAKSSFALLGDSVRNLDFDKFKIGLAGLKTALASTGILLLVQGVTYLIENFDELSQGSGLLAKSLRFVGDVIATIKDAVFALTDALGLTNSELDKQGEAIKTNADKATEALARQTAEYDRQIAIAKASGKSAVDLEIAKQKAIIETNKALVQQTIAYVRSGGILDEEQNKLLTGQLEAIKSATAQIDVIKLQEVEKEKDKNKKILEDYKKLKKAEKDEDDRRYNEWLAGLDKYYQAEKERRLKERADALAIDSEEIQRELDKEARLRQSKVIQAEINALANQDDIDAQIAFLNQKRINELNADNITFEQKELINARYAKQFEDLEKKKTDIAKAEEQRRNQTALDLASKSIAATQALTDAYFAFKMAKAKGDDKATLELAKKQFNINKGLQIANATIQGVQAVLAAFSSGSAVPIVGTVLGPVYAALAGITAAAQIAKISSTKFDASGGGGGASLGSISSSPSPTIPSPPTISTPNNNVSGTQFDSSGNVIQNNQQQTITVKAQVVESEMTDSQNTISKYKKQSTF